MRVANGTAITHEVVAAAAIRCFERYGPQRTSMADVADEAKISRQSVYRVFKDRSALIEYILDQRVSAMAEGLKATFSKYKTLEEALVEGTIASLRVSQEDTLMSQIFATSLDQSIELFLLRGTKNIARQMKQLWGPFFAQARADGKIAASVSDDRILEWIRHVHTAVRMHEDRDLTAHRKMLRDFFVPSIISK